MHTVDLLQPRKNIHSESVSIQLIRSECIDAALVNLLCAPHNLASVFALRAQIPTLERIGPYESIAAKLWPCLEDEIHRDDVELTPLRSEAEHRKRRL